MLTLLIGGVRSGKSTRALRRAEETGAPVTFIATAERIDADLAARIDRHREERPAHWSTIEEPLDLARAVALAPPGDTVVIDCLTVWVANLLHHLDTDTVRRDLLIAELGVALTQRSAPTIVVSNEVGMGVHPETALGRRYRDELGRVNQKVGALADEVVLCVAGRTLRLDDDD